MKNNNRHIVITIALVLISAYVLRNNKERMKEKTEPAKVVNANNSW